MSRTKHGKLHRSFEVSSVRRTDVLTACRLTKEEVLKFTDDDMRFIARRMGNAHTEYGGYWDTLELAVNEVEEKHAKNKEERN